MHIGTCFIDWEFNPRAALYQLCHSSIYSIHPIPYRRNVPDKQFDWMTEKSSHQIYRTQFSLQIKWKECPKTDVHFYWNCLKWNRKYTRLAAYLRLCEKHPSHGKENFGNISSILRYLPSISEWHIARESAFPFVNIRSKSIRRVSLVWTSPNRKKSYD